VRGTHILESAKERPSHDTEKKRTSDGTHELESAEGGGGKSGHGRRARKGEALTFWKVQRERHVRTPKDIEQETLTSCRAQMREQVRTWKECERPRRTYSLEGAERGIL
jgi:hypothetical protein